MSIQFVDLTNKTGRANLTGLLTGQVHRVIVEAEKITLIYAHGTAVISIEGYHEDRTLEAEFTAQVNDLVPCRWCGTETKYLGSRECDRCFELHDKLSGADPDILARMAEELQLLHRMNQEITANG